MGFRAGCDKEALVTKLEHSQSLPPVRKASGFTYGTRHVASKNREYLIAKHLRSAGFVDESTRYLLNFVRKWSDSRYFDMECLMDAGYTVSDMKKGGVSQQDIERARGNWHMEQWVCPRGCIKEFVPDRTGPESRLGYDESVGQWQCKCNTKWQLASARR